MLTVAELLDLVVRLEDDSARRDVLDGQSFRFFQAAVDEGLVEHEQIEGFAEVIGRAYQDKALGFRWQHGGAHLPSPDQIWTNHAFQSRGGYHSTYIGQQIAALFRERRAGTGTTPPPAPDPASEDRRDLFICHASQDKDEVVRPLAEALEARGWSVWLDEQDLTLGDSLSGNIELALARSRFGVAILSPASFAKRWPQRELQGLAAREVTAGTKVILPVWHEVDERYIVERAPILADRVGAKTTEGIPAVADQISSALERAGMEAASGSTNVVRSVEESDGPLRVPIPTTTESQDVMIAAGADWWEYALFAGTLVEGLSRLETKWEDHELRLANGPRRALTDNEVSEYLQGELDWLTRQVAALDRILTPESNERAFGRRGEPGDANQIRALTRRIVSIYDALLDQAAAMRSTSVPSRWRELVDVTAEFLDSPLIQTREFVKHSADQVAILPELAADGTEENPVRITLALTVGLDEGVKQRHAEAVDRLSTSLGE
jgi:TIR domain